MVTMLGVISVPHVREAEKLHTFNWRKKSSIPVGILPITIRSDDEGNMTFMIIIEVA